ncbi:TonB-dependent receptor [Sphingosinicella sp. BN140058]|uniref:TonB-dependent receptor n=1 Tax=Sphingosinicella sp. BN140058 TaxID=1892855 RepID=UPI0013EBFFAF|nr:TonB-dependent receptor [Sphingosinicella sp. BN140058]
MLGCAALGSSIATAQGPAQRAAGKPPAPDPKPGAVADKAEERILVSGRRPPVVRTPDGTRYDTRDNAQGQSGSAADLLNTVPSVSVSADGNVTVRGDGNVQIRVDGRPSAGLNGDSRADMLQGISGSAIASVEVITNPSAKFGAEGGTILNIVLKRGGKQGLHGSARVNVGDRGRKNAAVGVEHGAGKLSATFNGSLRDEVRLTRVDDDRRLLDADGRISRRYVTSARYTPTHARAASADGSVRYAVSDTADLAADFTVWTGSPKNRVYETHRDYLGGDEPVALYDRVRRGTYVGNNLEFGLSYSDRGTGGGPTLSLTGQHSRTSLRADRPFTTFYRIPPSPPTGERVFNHSRGGTDRLAIDHERPFGSSLRVGLGGEWKRERSRLENGRAAFDPSGQSPPAALPLSRFDARQRSAALYATLQFRTGAWTLQAGERFERLGIDVAVVGGDSVERDLAGFNHSASVTREMGDDRLVLRLSRSRQRFDPRDLNPNLVIVDAQNRSIGNPALLPQIVTSGEVEYGLNRGSLDATATLYARRTGDLIVDETVFLPNNVALTTKGNGGRSQAVGGQLVVSDAVGKTLKYSVTGNVFCAELPAFDPSDEPRRSKLSYTLQATLDWDATTRDKIHLDANLQSGTLVAQGVRTGTGAVNLVWRHRLSPQWTISLTAQGLVRDIRVRTILHTPTAIGINDRSNGARALLVGIAWTP